MSTRTVSARIDGKLHQQVLEICNQQGMTVNQFIVCLIDGYACSESDIYGKASDQNSREIKVHQASFY